MQTDPLADSVVPGSSAADVPSSPVTRLRRGEVLLALEDGSPVVEPPTKLQRGQTRRDLADLPQVPLFPAGPAMAAPASSVTRGDDKQDKGDLASNSSMSRVTIVTAPFSCGTSLSKEDVEVQPRAVFVGPRGDGKPGRRRRKRVAAR